MTIDERTLAQLEIDRANVPEGTEPPQPCTTCWLFDCECDDEPIADDDWNAETILADRAEDFDDSWADL